MKDDLISRRAAIEELSAQDVYTEQDVRTAYVDGYSDGIHRGYEDAVRNYRNLALKLCEKGKPDDLISHKRKHGEWITDDLSGIIHCNQCRSDAPMETTGGGQYKSNFCPYCGAEMTNGIQRSDKSETD